MRIIHWDLKPWRNILKTQYLRNPEAIYHRSFEIIEEEADLLRFPREFRSLVTRLIHSCGMVDLQEQIRFHPKAVEQGVQALNNGGAVICDSMMVYKGIIKRHLPSENQVQCWIEEPSVIEHAQTKRITRSMAAVDLWSTEMEDSVLAIGNAPTALFRLLELLEEGARPPALILGFPVGFVGAAESKQLLEKEATRMDIPYVTVLGRWGGSAMASAAVNAIARGVS